MALDNIMHSITIKRIIFHISATEYVTARAFTLCGLFSRIFITIFVVCNSYRNLVPNSGQINIISGNLVAFLSLTAMPISLMDMIC